MREEGWTSRFGGLVEFAAGQGRTGHARTCNRKRRAQALGFEVLALKTNDMA